MKMLTKSLKMALLFVAASLALTSCETKSDVTSVCSDMIKTSIHKSARSLVEQKEQALTISEYEFLGGVDDDRLVYRTLSFGNGVYKAKRVDTLSYQYGNWADNNTSYSLFVTPRDGEPYTLWYKSNSLVTPDGRVLGGETANNIARVEKWEKTLASFPNTGWEATFRGEYVVDSIYEDSIKTTFIPPMTFKKDTLRVWKGKMDTLNADTTCYFSIQFNHDPQTLANTGHFYKNSVRSKYDRDTESVEIISQTPKEYDFNWYFLDVTSDAKFSIVLSSTTPGVAGDTLSISKYKTDDAGESLEFLLGGLTYTHPVVLP